MDIKEIAAQYKYCTLCRGSLAYGSNNRLKCRNCGHGTFINPTPCNAAIIENADGAIMLVKRKTEPKMGYWDLPGGFVEPGESYEESTIREVKEELGVDIKDLKYIASKHDEYKFENVTFPTLGVIYFGQIGDQVPTPADDITELKFFKKNEIPYEQIAFDALKEALRNYIK